MKFLLLASMISFNLMATEKVEVYDLKPTTFSYMFELKTNKFENVILDCQSFIHNLTIKNQNQVVKAIYLDIDYDNSCQDIYNYISSNLKSKQKVCITYENEGNEINIENSVESECL